MYLYTTDMHLYVMVLIYMYDIGVAESCDSALRHYEYAANHVVEQIVSTHIYTVLHYSIYHVLCQYI